MLWNELGENICIFRTWAVQSSTPTPTPYYHSRKRTLWLLLHMTDCRTSELIPHESFCPLCVVRLAAVSLLDLSLLYTLGTYDMLSVKHCWRSLRDNFSSRRLRNTPRVREMGMDTICSEHVVQWQWHVWSLFPIFLSENSRGWYVDFGISEIFEPYINTHFTLCA